MLIHKPTRYVLSHVWSADGENLIEAAFRTVDFDPRAGLFPDEWWEIPNKSELATLILKKYPDFEPIENKNGELNGIRLLTGTRSMESKEAEQDYILRLRENAKKQGYQRKYRKIVAPGVFSSEIESALLSAMERGGCHDTR